MAFDTINTGAVANDGTGDPARTWAAKSNANFGKAVEGPASATADHLVAFDGVTGKLVKGAGSTVATLEAATSAAQADVDGVLGGATATAQTLRAWTEAGAYEATAITFDSGQVVTTATVKWPDGSAGVFTTVTKNTTWLAVDAYTITHADSGKTITQAAVTRDATTGDVTAKPALSVA